MQALTETRARPCADLSSVRRTGRPTKSPRFQQRRGPSLKATTSRLGFLRALSTDNPVPVSVAQDESVAEERTMGWEQNFHKHYDLNETTLGEGSFGVVKTATKKETGKKYAVKIMSKQSVGEWEKISAMVVHLKEVYEDTDNLYIVQELCGGGDVQHFLMEKGTVSEDEAAQVVTPILKMLASCHEKKICFGDVKPANFMLKERYPCKRHRADPTAPKGDIIVKGIDFGCSQKISEEGKLKKRTGTPLYMAPEIFFGWYSVEVDIWAAGMMLYQMIAGKLPFFGDQAEQLKRSPTFMVVQAVMESELDFSGAAWNGISTELKELIRALLDVDYNTRLTAKAALHHPWIKRHSRDHVIVRESYGNIIKFPGSSENTVLQSGGNDGHEN